MPDATELVDAIGKAGGRYDGHRAAHAKGVVLTGTFTPTAEAAQLTRAAHFAGDHDFVGGRQRLASDTRLRIGAEEEIEHGV